MAVIEDPGWNWFSTNVTANRRCGEDARHYFETFVNETEWTSGLGSSLIYYSISHRYIITSGIPNHAAECGQIHANKNQRCKISQCLRTDINKPYFLKLQGVA